MNTEIANILKSKIEDLEFVDVIAGLVDVAEKKSPKGAVIKFPISRDVTFEQCETGRYKNLAPDSKKKSVLFFEDLGVQNIGKDGKRELYSSNTVLVGWLNLKKIGCTDIGYTSSVVASIMKRLDCRKFHSGVYQNLNITVSGQQPRSKSIFSAYTFRDDTQYLMFPYDYFALKINVTFSINPQCAIEVVNCEEKPCLEC